MNVVKPNLFRGIACIATGVFLWLSAFAYKSDEAAGWLLSASGCVLFVEGFRQLFEGTKKT